MRNLKKTNLCTPIDFFDKAVNCKKDNSFQQWAAPIRAQLKVEFDLYDAHLNNDTLENLRANNVWSIHKDKFLQLYAYKRACIKKLRSNIIELSGKIHKCPYCSIGPVGSMDHYLPKEEFVYYSVHPFNLIPCCKDCNTSKNKNWLDMDSNRRLFLNSYVDDVERVQFLFVKIDVSGNEPDCTYYVENVNRLNARMFKIVESHFAKLELDNRYMDQSYEVITTLASEIQRKKRKHSDDEIIKEKKEEIDDNKKQYGCNNWKLVLEYECVDNPTVYSYLSQMQL